MYIIVVMLSKPLETSNELEWEWFSESNGNHLKNVPKHEIFQNSFFSREKGGVKVVYNRNDF